jgi:hypothetical protein
VFNRRIFFGGAAVAAVLASSAFTAGTAMAGTTPQLTNPAASMLQAGPASTMPGLTGILQAVPSGSLLSQGGTSGVTGVTGASSAAPLGGATPAAKDARSVPRSVTGATGTGRTSGKSGTSPTSAVNGVTSGSSGLPDLNAASVPAHATSVIPSLGMSGASLPTGYSAPAQSAGSGS